MHFPVSGVDVSPWLPPLIACVVSFFTSMGGVSGAFLLLPFQMSVLGLYEPRGQLDNQLFNIVAHSQRGLPVHPRGPVVWPMTWAVIVGTCRGCSSGPSCACATCRDAKHFKLVRRHGAPLHRRPAGPRPDEEEGPRARDMRGRAEVSRSWCAPIGRRPEGAALAPVCVRAFSLRRICYEFSARTYEGLDLGNLKPVGHCSAWSAGGGLRHRRRGAHRAFLRFFSACRSTPWPVRRSWARSSPRWRACGLLPDHRAFYPAVSVGPGLVLGRAFRHRRHGRHVPGARGCQKVRAGALHQVDAGRLHSFPGG